MMGKKREKERWRVRGKRKEEGDGKTERTLLSELHVGQGNIASYRKRARASRWLRVYARNAKPPLSLKRDSYV